MLSVDGLSLVALEEVDHFLTVRVKHIGHGPTSCASEGITTKASTHLMLFILNMCEAILRCTCHSSPSVAKIPARFST